MNRPVTVIGMDGCPPGPEARQAIARARVAVGHPRHLDAADLPANCERIPISPLPEALDRLQVAATGSVASPASPVVLASGDPGFFGIVRRLRAEGFAPTVLPTVSSVAATFARLGRSWDAAAVVSAHGRGLGEALNACRALPVVAVLTEPGAGPAELGAGLAGWGRRLAVAERLGEEDERVVELTAEDAAGRAWAYPNVVVSLREPEAPGDPSRDNQPGAGPYAGWALPETAYDHRHSMITKAEVRALAVARLRPRLGRLVWDIGAGSGSVGIECAALRAAVVAVDADPEACGFVRANADRHGVDVRVVCGSAPGALADLPDPDAAFVGGGGLDVLSAVAARHPARMVVTLVALDRIAPAVQALRTEGYIVDGVQLAATRLADLAGGSLRLAATNPVVVLTGDRT